MTTPVRAEMDWTRLEAVRGMQLEIEGESDIVTQLVAMFKDDGAKRVARAREALQHRDAKSLRLEAHSMKGTAGLLGATTLREAAAAVERQLETESIDTIGPLVDAAASRS